MGKRVYWVYLQGDQYLANSITQWVKVESRREASQLIKLHVKHAGQGSFGKIYTFLVDDIHQDVDKALDHLMEPSHG